MWASKSGCLLARAEQAGGKNRQKGKLKDGEEGKLWGVWGAEGRQALAVQTCSFQSSQDFLQGARGLSWAKQLLSCIKASSRLGCHSPSYKQTKQPPPPLLRTPGLGPSTSLGLLEKRATLKACTRAGKHIFGKGLGHWRDLICLAPPPPMAGRGSTKDGDDGLQTDGGKKRWDRLT